MRRKSNKQSSELKKYKKVYYKGDYNIVLAKAQESDSSITKSMVLNAFNNRSVEETKIVKISAAAKELYRLRIAETK